MNIRSTAGSPALAGHIRERISVSAAGVLKMPINNSGNDFKKYYV
jgi:hypothetical protein